MNITAYFRESSVSSVFAVGCALDLIIGVIDYATGSEIGLSVFYLAPIAFVVWFGGRRSGLLMSVIAVLTMIMSDLLGSKLYSRSFVESWNYLVHLTSFVIVTYLISWLKLEIEERARFILELQKALNEVKTLSGLLPMCAWCKNVRDDKGYWQKVEDYIAKHSDAEFTHGICPDCLKKTSPEVYNKLVRNNLIDNTRADEKDN